MRTKMLLGAYWGLMARVLPGYCWLRLSSGEQDDTLCGMPACLVLELLMIASSQASLEECRVSEKPHDS
jgi:hypothetical protein